MRLVRFLIYALAVLIGLYLLAAVLYAIPMIGGVIDDTMEVKFDRSDSSIVAECGLILPKAQAPRPDHDVHEGPQPPRCNIALSERAAEVIGSESGRRL